MATVDFLPFAYDPDANVQSQSDYLSNPSRVDGFSAGIAQSAQLNKVWRQTSMMTAAMANVIANVTGQDVLDNGDLGALITKLTTALAATGGSNGGSAAGTPIRLTLAQGTAVPDNDVSAATVIYMTAIGGNLVRMWNGTIWNGYAMLSDVALGLDVGGHVAGQNYSVFAYPNGSNVAIGTGPTWTSGTSPGSGAGTSEVENFQGALVNRYPITLRNNASTVNVPARSALLVGGFRCAVNGQVSDTLQLRHLSNVYNRAIRPVVRLETVASWNLPSSGAYRQVNANTQNQVELFQITSGAPVNLRALNIFINSTSSQRTSGVGIGIDSTSVDSSQVHATISADNTRAWPIECQLMANTGLGFHFFPWLEFGGTTDTRTAYGNGLLLSPTPVAHQSGMTGVVIT